MNDKNLFTEKDVKRLHKVLDQHKQSERKERKPSTPTGLSLIDIAFKLKQQHPDLSVDDAKKQAREIQKAQEHVNYGGSKLRHQIYTGVLGKNLGDRIARYTTSESGQEKAHGVLSDFHKEPPSEEKKLLHVVVDKLDTIQKEIKAIKVEPPAAPTTATATAAPAPTPIAQTKSTRLTPAIHDAHLALQGLGYKKQTVKDMLEGLPAHASTEEAIRYGLAKDKKSVRIAAAQVPQAAAESVHQLRQEKAETVKVAPTPQATDESVHQIRQEKAEIAKVAHAPPPTPTKIENAPPPAPVDSLKKPEKSTLGADSQKKAAEWEKLRAEQEAAIKRQKRMDFLIGVVEDIKKAVHGKGLFPFIAGLLALAIKGIVGTALKLLAKGALRLITGMTKLVWSAMKTIGSSIMKMVAKGWEAIKAGTKFVGEEAAKGTEKMVAKFAGKEGAKIGEKTVLKSVLKKIPIVGALAGLGFGAYELSKGNLKGAGLEVASGVASTLPGLGTVASLGLDVAAAVQEHNFDKKAEATTPPEAAKTNIMKGIGATTQANQMKPDETQNDLLSKIIGDETDGAESMSPSPPVIIAPQTNVMSAPKKDDSQPVIQVHNMEQSVGAYLASIFDHPVFFTSLGGM